jgi:hypothetical protein
MAAKTATGGLHWVYLLVTLVFTRAVLGDGGPKPRPLDPNPAFAPSITKGPDLLDVIQITPEVHILDSKCNQTLMEHSFGLSYGKPFVKDYVPPQCDYNRVIMTFKVTSQGRQFDRLALMYFNDTEVWRTSTAEPTLDGIEWTYIKDMSQYISLWKQPQKLIFDLGNLVDKTYTAPFNTTLTVTYFKSISTQPPADLIIPISKRLGSQSQPSAFKIPDEGAAKSVFTIPQNAKRAIFSISACGQGDEEFWWSNVPQSSVNAFTNNSMPGYSPWRELQVYVDGSLTGVAWPFPIIFTGGVVPGFWRPLVGIDAYDLREDEIDLTPWLPLLSDGKDHSFEIKVVGLNDDSGKVSESKVNSNWVVTGKLFLWLDKPGSITKGDLPRAEIAAPTFRIEQTQAKLPNGTLDSLVYKVTANREIKVEGSITTSEGTKPASWQQSLEYSNFGNLTAGGLNQSTVLISQGDEGSTSGYTRKFKYPLNCTSNTKFDAKTKELYIGGTIKREKELLVTGRPVHPYGLDDYDSKDEPEALGYKLNTTQQGEAWYHNVPGKNQSEGSGTTEQVLAFYRTFGELPQYPGYTKPSKEEFLYSRHILAKGGKITKDQEVQLEGISPKDPPIIRFGSSAQQPVLGLEDLKRAGGKRIESLLASDPVTQGEAVFSVSRVLPAQPWFHALPDDAI